MFNFTAILACVGFFVSVVPTIIFYLDLFYKKNYNKLVVLFGFCAFHFICGLSVYSFFYEYYFNSPKITTLLPLFFLMQILIYSLFVLAIPLFALIRKIYNKSDEPTKYRFTPKTIPKCLMFAYDKLSIFYTLPYKMPPDFFLSQVFLRMYLSGCFVLSAVFVASGFANGLFLDVFSHQSPKALQAFTEVYSSDLQLYVNIVLVSTIPIMLSLFFSKKREHHAQ